MQTHNLSQTHGRNRRTAVRLSVMGIIAVRICGMHIKKKTGRFYINSSFPDTPPAISCPR